MLPTGGRFISNRSCRCVSGHARIQHPAATIRLLPLSATTTSELNRLLNWADEGINESVSEKIADKANGSPILQRPVHVTHVGGAAGRGLVATRAVEPGETLLSVPFDKLFKSDEEIDEMHWAVGMALRLLEAKKACHDTESAAFSLAASQDQLRWGDWINALPSLEDLKTPLSYGENEVAALGDPGAIEEVIDMQACIRACYEVVVSEEQSEAGAGSAGQSHATSSRNTAPQWEDFLWAVQIFTSRCFYEPSLGCHLAVPGIDMANHRCWDLSL